MTEALQGTPFATNAATKRLTATAIRAELRVLPTRASVWLILSIWLVCLVVFGYVVSSVSLDALPGIADAQIDGYLLSMTPQGSSYYILASMPMYCAPLLVVLGTLLAGSDLGRGIARTLFVRLGNHRGSYLAGKTTVAVVVSALVAGVTVVGSVTSSFVLAASRNLDMSLPAAIDLLLEFVALLLVSLTFLLVGMAIAYVVGNSLLGAGIGLLGIIGVETLLLGALAPLSDAAMMLRDVLPAGAAGAIAVALTPNDVETLPTLTTSMPGAAGVAVLIAWCVLACVVSRVAVQRYAA